MLPTTAFGEEHVSFTNTERRIQLAQKVVEPPAGTDTGMAANHAGRPPDGEPWNYQSSAEVMDEIADAVPFYSGASYENLAREYGRQWPCTTENPLGTPYLFADQNGEARFKFVAPAKPAQETAGVEGVPFHLGLRAFALLLESECADPP